MRTQIIFCQFSLYQRMIMLFFMLLMTGCSQGEKTKTLHTLSVNSHSFAHSLFYTGIIQPLQTMVIASPAEGVVMDMHFQYGDKVNAGQLLFVLSSEKFMSDYKSALLQYIKTKNDFNNAKVQLTEARFLHQNQLISDDDFKLKQSNFYAARLALLQANDLLENLLKQSDIKPVNFSNLTIANIDKIAKAIQLPSLAQKNLRILAPKAGIILSPYKNEEETKKLNKGDLVKIGDVLAVINDSMGFSVRIRVNELTINQIRLHQKVKVTGIAFPEDALNGEITRIDLQGESNNGGLPTFFVEIAIPKLTKMQQQIIHVGMSAKVQIDIAEEAKILIPLTSMKEKNGKAYVALYDEKNKRVKEVAVKTGKTTIDSIAILSGLKEGDKIVIPD